MIRQDMFAAEPVDFNLYGLEGDVADNDNGDNDDETDIHVECNPIICSLSEDQLALFREVIDPISFDTPLTTFTNLYHNALQVVNEIMLLD
jgi:hypothetical protein